MTKIEMKRHRTAIYALIFGPADTAKAKGDPEDQKRTAPRYGSTQLLEHAGNTIVSMFPIACFSRRRERELIAYLNKCREPGVRAFIYEPPIDDDDEVVEAPVERSSPIRIRAETKRALEAWGA